MVEDNIRRIGVDEESLEDQVPRLIEDLDFSEYRAKDTWLTIRDRVSETAEIQDKEFSEDVLDGMTNLMIHITFESYDDKDQVETELEKYSRPSVKLINNIRRKLPSFESD